MLLRTARALSGASRCMTQVRTSPASACIGAGAELRQPLGVSIVGGLLLSQLITLFIAPVLYLGFDSLGASRARPEPMSAISSQS
ncbi:efflux RND transporter permease subunit [Ralstonia pickettii]|nr:hypothetical protein [Ralstonia pickettii]MBB0032943.1 hypothetical protein [Ralstonia pickettii]MBB0095586.1 hypothetical protein [Ralstonia pickettii]MBB0105411.1 hypothetical protein [Ralstonia pickettii]MBB0127026.1 hypothetical protein [Ralstonia pickettii]